MARIGIYGGSFNPPHLGHVLAAGQCRELLGLDRLILIPDAIPPHKELPAGSPTAQQRLEMVCLAFEDCPGSVVSDIELRRTGKSYTADTLCQLRELYPRDELFLLMGTDMYLSFDRWWKPELISKLATVVCMFRSEADEPLQAQLEDKKLRYTRDYSTNTIFARNEALEISSTQVRRLLFFDLAQEALPEKVLAYIKKNRLYSDPGECRGLELETLMTKSLSLYKEKRKAHALGCMETAAALAERYGADVTAAKRAAILHDVTKALTGEEQLLLCCRFGLPVSPEEAQNPELLHAKTAAWAAEQLFGESRAVCSAIRWHTTGKADMTALEKILYIADYAEPTRDFPGVDAIRQALERDLDEGVMLGLHRSLAYVRQRGLPVAPQSQEALAFLQRKEETNAI